MKKSRQEAAFEGTVRDIASDGRGVVLHPDGRAFFVAGAWLGERVLVTPTGRKGDVGFGEVREVLEPSPDRRPPPCAHHGTAADRCGGCPWMFINYSAQLNAKAARLQGLVERLLAADPRAVKAADGEAHVSASVLQPIQAAPAELGYRNRAQFKTDGLALGYMAAGSNQLVDVQACPVLNSNNQEHLAALRALLPSAEWKSDKRRGIYWHTLDIDDQLTEARLDGRLPFRQGNTEQNGFMRDWLATQIQALEPSEQVLELFAGAGNFTEILSHHFEAVIAVEGDNESIAALGQLADQGVSATRCDLFSEDQVSLLVQKCRSATVLVLDPPRDGLRIRLPIIQGLKKLETVIYVSCDPATWARDCRDFLQAGFVLELVQPVDQFPQTPHVELLSVLRRTPR